MSAQEVATRVIPSYRTKLGTGSAIGQGVVGVTLTILGPVGLSIKAFTSVGSSCLLAGIPLILCSIIGILASHRNIFWRILTYFVLSVVCLAMCLTLLGAAIVGVRHEESRPSEHPVGARQAVDIVSLICAVCGAILSVMSIVICTIAVFYGCCKPTSGARYVTNSVT